MEAIKLAVDIDRKRKVVVDLPGDIPLGKAELMIIIQPLKDKRENSSEIDLSDREITLKEAADMRNRVRGFADDWNAPGMEVCDEL